MEEQEAVGAVSLGEAAEGDVREIADEVQVPYDRKGQRRGREELRLCLLLAGCGQMQ